VSSNIISIEEFQKLDIRIGLVKNAERIEGTKLLKLTVDINQEERIIVSGIGDYYSPSSLLGKKVVVLVNLKPKKIRGVESQGMILAAGCEENGIPRILTVDGDAPPGSKVC
jgi:tRNA-binding protein